MPLLALDIEDYDIDDFGVTFNVGVDSRSDTFDQNGTRSTGQQVFNVLRHFNFEQQDEIQYLEKLQNVKITKETMQRNSIKLGLKYGFIVNDALNGNCKTPIISFQHNLR